MDELASRDLRHHYVRPLESETGNDPISVSSSPSVSSAMHTESAVGMVINELARDRVLEYIQTERRTGRSVVTLVDISEETALAPETVEAVMAQFEADVDVPVRRATADQLRWHIRR